MCYWRSTIKLDGDIQFFFSTNTITGRGHSVPWSMASVHVKTEICVLTGSRASGTILPPDPSYLRVHLIAAVYADVTCENGKHGNSAGVCSPLECRCGPQP